MENSQDRENMIDFIKRTFGKKVSDSELQTDEQIQKVYQEALNYSDWGL